MNLDPTRNVVAFARRGGDPLLAEAPARDDDCIEQAWEIIRHDHRARPGEVNAVHSEWQPSLRDAAFIGRTFPGAAVTYNFPRPTDGNWVDAFATARRTIEAGVAAERAHAAAPVAAPTPPTAGRDAGGVSVAPPGARGGSAGSHPAGPAPTSAPSDVPTPMIADPDAEVDGKEFLPMLIGPSSAKGAAMSEYLFRMPFVPNVIDIAFALVGPTPHGTVGMDWLTVGGHEELGSPPLEKLFAVACHNLVRGLTVTQRSSDDGAMLLELKRPVGQGGSAVVLPNFLAQLGEPLKADKLVVGIPNPDQLLVAAADTEPADDVRTMTLESSCTDMFLGPMVLELSADGIRVLASREI